jgi:hypothetical protein
MFWLFEKGLRRKANAALKAKRRRIYWEIMGFFLAAPRSARLEGTVQSPSFVMCVTSGDGEARDKK